MREVRGCKGREKGDMREVRGCKGWEKGDREKKVTFSLLKLILFFDYKLKYEILTCITNVYNTMTAYHTSEYSSCTQLFIES